MTRSTMRSRSSVPTRVAPAGAHPRSTDENGEPNGPPPRRDPIFGGAEVGSVSTVYSGPPTAPKDERPLPAGAPTPAPRTLSGDTVAQSIDSLSLGAGYDRVVDRVFRIDADGEYAQLETRLKLSMRASRADYGSVVDALDEAEDLARRAMALYVNGKVAVAAFEIDARVIEGALREQAVSGLEAEKERGERKKAITEGDVDGRIASMFPDEYRDLAVKRSKAKEVCVYFERLAELWKERARDLRAMVGNARQ